MPRESLVLIPSYNTGSALLERTLREALAATVAPVWVVIDGSDDGSGETAQALAEENPRLRVLTRSRNGGKGVAVRHGLQEAHREGFTHALVMDSDGQHPSDRIDDFLRVSRDNPDAMVLGQPIFDESVPLERLYGRKLSVWLVRFEAASSAIGDPLYGLRVYPIEPLLEVMGSGGRCNRYDFDPEVALRLHWRGVAAVKLPAKVNYLNKADGGVSHFHYLRDNARFVWLHFRLLVESPYRWVARLLRHRGAGGASS